MAVWRCPHCSTPQAESARCWVCRRSTTSCATCRHFHRAVANGLGLCGLDPRRVALTGSEMRACWAAPDPALEPVPGPPPHHRGQAAADAGARRPRTFVPVDELMAARAEPAAAPVTPVSATPAAVSVTPRWSLWGDAEA